MAVTEADEIARDGASTVEQKGSSASKETALAASAWNSFCEEDGSEAGEKGTGFSAGFAQHAGVEQFLELQSV